MASWFRTAISGGARSTSTLAHPSEGLREYITGGVTSAGTTVGVDRSLAILDVYAAARKISQDIGSIPCIVYAQGADEKRGKARDTRLWTLLHESGNPDMSSGELFAITIGHLSLWGNAYWEKVYDARGLVTELWPIRPNRVQVRRNPKGVREYVIQRDGGLPLIFTDQQILHIRNFGTDGLVGLSPIGQARQDLGIQIAQADYQGSFYTNDATPGGVLQVPEGATLDDETHARMLASWRAAHQGHGNKHQVALLEGGTTFENIEMPMKDQQFIEQRNFSTQQIARLFNLPAWTLGASSGDSLTYANTEQSMQFYIQHTLRPLCTLVEQCIRRDPELTGGRTDLYPEFQLDALQRGDITTRYLAYNIATGGQPFMTPNEIRERENLAPMAPAPTTAADATATDTTIQTEPQA